MEGVEIRPDLVVKINEIIKESGMKDFRFVESSIEAYACQQTTDNRQQASSNLSDSQFFRFSDSKNLSDSQVLSFSDSIDVLIALHACNTATDDAIIKGIESEAKLIICAPCCHKQIRQEMEKSKVVDAITRYGIFMERQAVMITDTIRALILEYFGYKTQVMEFIEMEHTPKNVLLVGRKTNDPDEEEKAKILNEIKSLKERYGIEKHYLEKAFSIIES